MNRSNWIRLERWYLSLNVVQQWSVKILSVTFIICCIILVTHEPSERKQVSKIILNCDHCGSDPERTISYNEYIERKEQAQKIQFFEAKQQIQQEVWNEKGRQRWCRNHPQDRNCR
jgi:type III secretory pathway component EscR